MKKLKIVTREASKYLLRDSNKEEYLLNLRFIGTDDINLDNIEYIYISNKLLNKKYSEYSNYYNFGPIPSKYGRKITDSTIQDVIILEVDNKEYYLQRYYG